MGFGGAGVEGCPDTATRLCCGVGPKCGSDTERECDVVGTAVDGRKLVCTGTVCPRTGWGVAMDPVPWAALIAEDMLRYCLPAPVGAGEGANRGGTRDELCGSGGREPISV